jgi:transposase
MRFYQEQHKFYAGIDLHARQMYICVIDSSGEVHHHRNHSTTPDELYRIIHRFGTDIVIGVECMFSWYWVADFCEEHQIPFALGHALYIKAIHSGKTKNDRIDALKIASMLRGGMFPLAHAYPKDKRATRDLLRRRMFFVHHRAALLSHITNTNTQYNNVPINANLLRASNREGIEDRFESEAVRQSIIADKYLLDHYHRAILDIESTVMRHAKADDAHALNLLRSIPGIGPVLALTILYEVGDIERFPTVANFISYSRLVKCAHESAGKRSKGGHNKIGNAHLKWAFSEAAVLLIRERDEAKRLHQSLSAKYGRAKSLSIIAQKLGRLVFHVLKYRMPFDEKRFFGTRVAEPVI